MDSDVHLCILNCCKVCLILLKSDAALLINTIQEQIVLSTMKCDMTETGCCGKVVYSRLMREKCNKYCFYCLYSYCSG